LKLHDWYNLAIGGRNLVAHLRHLKLRRIETEIISSFAMIFFEVLTGKVPFKDLPLKKYYLEHLGFTKCGLL
jgi:hypothetical protein